jgi:hypothetical protein
MLLAVAAAVVATPRADAIGISIYGPLGGFLNDAVLFASAPGTPTQYTVPLGRIDLSILTDKIIDLPIGDGTSTHWWIVARHQTGRVAYSSSQNLQGVDVMSVEPFSSSDASAVNTVLTQLFDVNNGGSFSSDIATLLSAGHMSHLDEDKGIASIYVDQLDFSGGSSLSWIGELAISLHNNIPPGFGPVPPVSTPASMPLLAVGLGGLAAFRKKRSASSYSIANAALMEADLSTYTSTKYARRPN